MPDRVTAAGVQMEIAIGDTRTNLARIIHFARNAHERGARIVVFPELALCGYCFRDLAEAAEAAESVPGPSTAELQIVCRELDILVLVGLLEKAGSHCYNAAVLVGPGGVIGNYRKIHLPFLGVDRHVAPGDLPFRVFDTPCGHLGWVICYDGSFPESVRCLALQGADIVLLPTNWPDGDEAVPRFIVPARAIENHLYYLAVNRVGTERGFHFIGRSMAVDPLGRVLATAASDREEIILAEMDLSVSRKKRVVVIPGENEFDRFADRRPEFYAAVAEPVRSR